MHFIAEHRPIWTLFSVFSHTRENSSLKLAVALHISTDSGNAKTFSLNRPSYYPEFTVNELFTTSRIFLMRSISKLRRLIELNIKSTKAQYRKNVFKEVCLKPRIFIVADNVLVGHPVQKMISAECIAGEGCKILMTLWSDFLCFLNIGSENRKILQDGNRATGSSSQTTCKCTETICFQFHSFSSTGSNELENSRFQKKRKESSSINKCNIYVEEMIIKQLEIILAHEHSLYIRLLQPNLYTYYIDTEENVFKTNYRPVLRTLRKMKERESEGEQSASSYP